MCGIFSIYGHSEAAKITYLGLYALQHRGQESAGIVTYDKDKFHTQLKMGLVADIFRREVLDKLPGRMAIGHVRYSTAGGSTEQNIQPFVMRCPAAGGTIVVAHNGNLINAPELRHALESKGCKFSTTSDTEVLPRLMNYAWTDSFVKELSWSLKQLRGAYSLLMMTKKGIYAARDPYGVRPLSIGKIGNAYVLASETCAFDLIDAEFVRDVEPGELISVTRKGLESWPNVLSLPKKKLAYCIFEHIYFSRPDSTVYGKSVHQVRKGFGKYLAEEDNVNADIVIAVPDSANSTAVGYAETKGIPFETGLIRNHYIGRTFIEPRQSIRDFGAKIKYNPVRSILSGKRVIVVDDSIVRGTTSRKLMRMIRKSGAKEIHLRISCPPIKHSCFYGIDTPTEKELIAAVNTVEQIRKYIEVDTLRYLSLDGMVKATGLPIENFCFACFTGKYPIK